MQIILRYEDGPNAGLMVALMSQAQLDAFDGAEQAVVQTGIALACADVANKQAAFRDLVPVDGQPPIPPNWRDTPVDLQFTAKQEEAGLTLQFEWPRLASYGLPYVTPVLTPELLLQLGSTPMRFLALCGPVVAAANELVHRHWSDWVKVGRTLPAFFVGAYFGDPGDTVPPMGTT